jgi:four helix bundle protein
MGLDDYKRLIAWQKAMDLVEDVYRLTQLFPDGERFGLIDQLRRAVVSIPSNIAEGQGRGRGKDFERFLRMANGSRQEVETPLLISARLGYIKEQQVEEIIFKTMELGRIITGLRRSLRNDRF